MEKQVGLIGIWYC